MKAPFHVVSKKKKAEGMLKGELFITAVSDKWRLETGD